MRRPRLPSSIATGPLSTPLSRLDTLPVELPALTLGWEAAKWAAKYLKQPNGPRAGERFVFTTRQLRFCFTGTPCLRMGRGFTTTVYAG
jgi:hypothetical protein